MEPRPGAYERLRASMKSQPVPRQRRPVFRMRWTKMGLRESGRIGRILIHPTNPNIVFACALGRATGPQQERGVYRTTDGGQKWDRVLFVDPNTGCSSLSLDPKDPTTIVAGMWSLVMQTWKIESGGAGSGSQTASAPGGRGALPSPSAPSRGGIRTRSRAPSRAPTRRSGRRAAPGRRPGATASLRAGSRTRRPGAARR